MIKCPKCGAENLLGTIFCRSCGDKLDLNKLQPDDIIREERRRNKTNVKMILRIVRLVIFLILLFMIALMFLTPSGSKVKYEINQEEYDKAKTSLTQSFVEHAGNVSRRNERAFVFTQAELNAILDMYTGTTVEGVEDGNIKVTRSESKIIKGGEFSLRLSGDEIVIYKQAKLVGALPITLSMSYRWDSGKQQFVCRRAAIGRLGLPGKIRSDFESSLEQDLSELIKILTPVFKVVEVVNFAVADETGEKVIEIIIPAN